MSKLIKPLKNEPSQFTFFHGQIPREHPTLIMNALHMAIDDAVSYCAPLGTQLAPARESMRRDSVLNGIDGFRGSEIRCRKVAFPLLPAI